MRKSIYIFVCCLLSAVYSYGQTGKLDSLLSVLKNSKEDSIKINTLNALFSEYEFSDDEKARASLDEALALSKKINYKKGLGNTYTNLGYFAEDKSDYPEALKNYFASLNVRKLINDRSGIADSYNNIGLIYSYQGNYPEALKNQLASLKIREGMHDKVGVAASYNNIGLVYYFQADYEQALKNYFSSLLLKKAIGDKKGVASTYNNIGNVYYIQGNYEVALENYFASLKINEALGAQKGIGFCYNNIGSVYAKQAELEKDKALRKNKLNEALKNYFASLKIREIIGNKAGMASCCINIGVAYTKEGKYREAEKYLNKAKELSVEIGYKEILRDAYGQLTELDSAQGNYKGAFENHKMFILYRDSLDNEETRKKTIQSQMTYDFEKKEAVATAEHKMELEKQKLVANERSRKQKIIILFVVCGLLLVIIFSGFIFRSLRTTRKQKNIIQEQKNIVELQKLEVELQKNIVEEHQKAIIDSITYARRIQQSLLPREKYIQQQFDRLKK